MTSRVLGIVVQAQGAAAAAAAVGKVDSAVGRVNRRAGTFASTLNKRVSGALGTFSGRLRGFATAGLGLFGVGGLFALGSAFKGSIDKAREFGEASRQLARITGQSIDTTSRLVDVLDKYGIEGAKANKIAGMLTKNVGNMRVAKKAAEFTEKFGLQVRDSKGHVLTFNQQLLESADFFTNKSIPAWKKNAAMAKIYGRSWQDLLPVLALGRKGLEDQMRSAMHLSEEDIAAVIANKQATIEWDDAIGDLQTRIGIDLLPTLTEMATTLTSFVQGHGNEIRDFFRNAVDTGKKFGGAALDAVKGIQSVWNAIPEPVRDLLIKGLIADRTVKFLFGFSVTGLAKEFVGGAVKGLGGALIQAGIGKAFVQPVFVTNQGFGAGGGGVGGAARSGVGALGMVAGIALPAAVAAITAAASEEFNKNPERQRLGIGGQLQATTGLDLAAFQNLAVFAEALPKFLNDINNPAKVTPFVDKRDSFDRSQLAEDRKTQERVNAVRDKIEAATIAQVSATNNAKTATVSRSAADADRIVAAIVRNATKVSVNVRVGGPGGHGRTQTGTTLHRQLGQGGQADSGHVGPGGT